MKNRVLFVGETAQLGGAEVSMLTVATCIKRRGWSPRILVPSVGPLTDHLSKRGIEWDVVPQPKFLSTSFFLGNRYKLPNLFALPINGVASSVWIRRLRRYFCDYEPAVVHTEGMWAHAFGGLAARLAGLPVVWHFQDIVDARSGWGLYRHLVTRWARYVPNRIVCISNKVAEQFSSDRQLSTKMQLIWNTVDVDAFDVERKSPTIDNGDRPLRIGTAARLTPWKGHHVALAAAAHLRRRGVPFRWYIAGDDRLGVSSYHRRLNKLIRDSNIEDAVEFVGWMDDMPAFYRSLDALVHVPTEPEPFGLVVAEGMAAGLPVVTTAGSGLESLVAEAGGIIVPPGESEPVADALFRLYDAPSTRYERGRRARLVAQKTFILDSHIEQWIALYKSLQDQS